MYFPFFLSPVFLSFFQNFEKKRRMPYKQRGQALLTDEDVDKFIDKYTSYEDLGEPATKEYSRTRRNSKTKTIRKPVIIAKTKKKKKQTRFLTSADRLRINRKRRKETDRRLRDLLQKEEKEKQLACVSGVSECNQLSNALNTGIRYEVIEDDGVVVGVRAKLKPGISARKRAMRSTKQLMTPDEFVRERARLKRMAEREIRRRRYSRKSESNLLTLGNLLAATTSSKASSSKTFSQVVKKTTTNMDAVSVQNAIDRALRDINEAKSKVETQTLEFEKSGWVFGFDVVQRGTRRDMSTRRRSF